MDEDLDDLLVKLGCRLDANYKTRLAAAGNLEQERQALLKNFRAAADGEILPRFNKTAERSIPVMLITVVDTPQAVELKVRMKKDEAVSVAGSLRYYADLDTRKLMMVEQVPGAPHGSRPAEASDNDLKPENITQKIAAFFNHLDYALRQTIP